LAVWVYEFEGREGGGERGSGRWEWGEGGGRGRRRRKARADRIEMNLKTLKRDAMDDTGGLGREREREREMRRVGLLGRRGKEKEK